MKTFNKQQDVNYNVKQTILEENNNKTTQNQKDPNPDLGPGQARGD